MDKAITDKVNLIWMAGFLDGEGNISLLKGLDKRWNCYWYSLDIQVVNTVELNLIPFVVFFGGIIRPKQPRGNRKIAYYWRPPNKLEFLKEIEPFLIGKSTQAKLGLEFLQRQKSKGGCGKGRLTTEQRKLREWYFQQFKTLNKRGL